MKKREAKPMKPVKAWALVDKDGNVPRKSNGFRRIYSKRLSVRLAQKQEAPSLRNARVTITEDQR